jgi:farnesyl-diphosphate farnesyltransferase
MTANLQELLKQTSRSFYLTLRVLPARVRPQIGLAYLLARTTDTIADTEIVPLDQRLGALQQLRERILGQNSAPLNFGELARQQGSPAEKLLLEKTEDSLAALKNFSAADQKLIRDVLATITSGQELDLKRFAGGAGVPPAVCGVAPQTSPDKFVHEADGATPSATRGTRVPPKIIALETDAELDDYTWRVAGCVGGFWTKICRAHLFPNAKLDEPQFIADGIRFGKGLQLVNILRDLPADLKKGRCYLPLENCGPPGCHRRICCRRRMRRNSCRCSAGISTGRSRTCARAGFTRTQFHFRNSGCDWRAHGRFSSARGRLRSCALPA